MFLPIREQPLTTEKPIKETIKQKNDISIIKQKIDSYLHLKMYKDKRCLVFVDIDQCPKNILNEILELISNELIVNLDDISYTTCKKKNNIITSH